MSKVRLTLTSGLFRARHVAVLLVILLPYSARYSSDPPDTATTILRLAAGGGSFQRVTASDCAGPTSVRDIPFGEFGGSIEHKFSALKVGLKADCVPSDVISFSNGNVSRRLFSAVTDTGTSMLVLAGPSVGVDLEDFGLELGTLANLTYPRSKLVPTGQLRLGNAETGYGTIGFGSNVPVFSGGGFWDIGLGGRIERSGVNLWGGVGFEPYRGAVFSFKENVKLSRHFVLDLHELFNLSQHFQFGGAVGGSYRF